MTSLHAFALILGAFGLQRLGEVVVSRRRCRTRPAVAEPRLFPAMVALHTASLTVPLAEAAWLERPFLPWLAGLSAAALLCAEVLRGWTLWSVRRAWNVWVVRPAPEEVVTHGPYAWVRHPNYLVVVLELVFLPLLHTAWISAIGLTALNALVLARRIRTEEAVLSQIPAWRDAMRDRKRLLPGIL
ncbi:MAG: hypothetical protein D6731_03580 [Planctomycetota bacterium]|nr:MAG: hypothetical protein D6731_03580 [Planctomycetota bacterium]